MGKRIDRVEELRWELIEITSKHGFVLTKVMWSPDSPEKKLTWNSIGCGLEIYVYGLPMDYPIDKLKKLVDKSLASSKMELMIDQHKPRFKWPIVWNNKKEESA